MPAKMMTPSFSKNMDNHMKSDSVDVAGLIRSIQRTEGHIDCFGKAKGECRETDCAWREYCLDERYENLRDDRMKGGKTS
jgi:hypothetical protein